jgi:hypothetical protein
LAETDLLTNLHRLNTRVQVGFTLGSHSAENIIQVTNVLSGLLEAMAAQNGYNFPKNSDAISLPFQPCAVCHKAVKWLPVMGLSWI